MFANTIIKYFNKIFYYNNKTVSEPKPKKIYKFLFLKFFNFNIHLKIKAIFNYFYII